MNRTITLSVITINRNNASGLEKTMQSVCSQTSTDFEYIVVDGASTDGSVDIIRRFAEKFGHRLKWISEPDQGIYNAMNKGIGIAEGDYVEFLNSGDCFLGDGVVEMMLSSLKNSLFPTILYGNMLKEMPDGRLMKDRNFAGEKMSFLGFYVGTLNHSSALIKKSMFEKYGLYDESLKIVSDWKWFMQAIILGEERPIYVDTDVSLFDMTGISANNQALCMSERDRVFQELINPMFLADYQKWAASIRQMKRIKRFPWADKLVWVLERGLFKWEKWRSKRKRIQEWQ